jgi:cobalamin biosynthesis Mg chelatase CobN
VAGVPSRVKLSRALFAVGLALLVAPSGAVAASSTAPPGNSGVDQYRESAPPSSGNTRKLDREQRSALASRGKDGKALADALDRNGGVPAPSGGSSGGSADTGTGGAVGGNSSSSDTSSDHAGAAEDAPSAAAPPAGSSEGAPKDVPSGSVTESAAASTVGPFPVWTMLVVALVLVGIGLVVRRRPSA